MKNIYLKLSSLLLLAFLLFNSIDSKAVTCSRDTIDYILYKSSAYNGITLGATSATDVAQYYRTPQPITVYGFQFYAYATGTPTVTLTCAIYTAAADSSPSGAPLRTVNITIDSSTSNIINYINFTTPVTVTSPYVLVVSNTSPTQNAVILCNSYAAGDGAGEFLALGRIAGTWLRGDDISVGGSTFDADWVLLPFVSYDNTDSIYAASTTVCAGSPLTFSGFTSNIINDDMYNVNEFFGFSTTNTFGWSFGDTTTARPSTQTVTHTYYTPGTYTLTLYDTMERWRVAPCIASRTLTITVLPSTVTSSFTSSAVSLVASFTNTSTSGITYAWSFGDGGLSSATSPSHTYTLPGRYNVCLTAYNICDTAVYCDSITVTCLPPAMPGAISGPTTYCPGDIDTFSISPVSGATSYTWTSPSWTGTSTTNSIILTAGVGAGNISVSANSICGSSTPRVLSISLGSPPVSPGTITGSATYCPGDTNTYSIVSVSGASSYTWSAPGWTGTSTTTSITLIASTSAGNISVTANNACGSSTPRVLTISLGSPPPTPGAITGSSTYCDSITYTYSVAPVSGATSYTWTTPGWIGTSTTNSITLAATVSSGTISVTCSNACGTSSASSLAVSPSSGPPTPGAITGATTIICPGSTQILSVPAVSGASSYVWTLPSGWSGASTTNSITAVVDTLGGTVSVAAQNSCGTSSPSSITYTLGSKPDSVGPISGPTAICANSTATYSIAPVSGATSYIWTLPSGWTGSSTLTNINTTTSSSSGNVSVVASNLCGNSTPSSLSVAITSISASTSSTPQTSTTANGTISVSTPSGGTPPYQFALDAGPFGPSGNFSSVVSDTHQVVIKDANGCIEILTVYVSSTVGIDITNYFNRINIYPNPTTDFINIDLETKKSENMEIELIDMLGNILYEENFENTSMINKNIDVTNFAKGNYIIKLTSNESQISKRISIQ
jgi:hypothetical protein